jgi:hypothetical protein
MKKIIYKKIKNTSLILILLLGILGCQKVFKDDIHNSFNLNTSDDYEVAMAGLYSRLSASVMGNSWIYIATVGNADDICPLKYDTRKEELDNKPGFSETSTVFNVIKNGILISSTNLNGNEFDIFYVLLFQNVGFANDILSKAGNINTLKPEFKKIIGEVYFIRAYSYYRLVRLFGQVPIVDNPDVDFTVKKPTIGQLYQFIENDLLMAMNLLPKTNHESRIKYETPCRGSAKALLAEVYLTMGGMPLNDQSKYADAARVAKEVIDSAAYFGFGLMPDLADLWNSTQPQNMERVFGIYFVDLANDTAWTFGQIGYPISIGSNTWYYNGFIVPPDFYNSFPRNYRKEVSFQTRHVPNNYTYTFDPVTKKSTNILDSLYLKHYDTINYNTSITYKKFFTQFSIPDSILLKNPNYPAVNMGLRVFGHYTGGVVYFFRYAQTLLTYAEARARSGAADGQAYEAINQVRRRANKVNLFSPSPYDLTPGLSTQQFIDSVVQERAWELCAEPEGRWFDLVRLNMAKDIGPKKLKQKIMAYPIPMDKNTFTFPIPTYDKLLNQNLN